MQMHCKSITFRMSQRMGDTHVAPALPSLSLSTENLSGSLSKAIINLHTYHKVR